MLANRCEDLPNLRKSHKRYLLQKCVCQRFTALLLQFNLTIANQICLANNNQVESISLLLEQSQNSRKSNDWIRLEKISISILQTLFKGNSLKDETLKQVVINYLSSIVGTGNFLTSLSSKDSDKYKQGLEKLNDFLDKKPHLFNSIDPIIQSGREIALLALEPTPQNRNKISKNLRAIARPDLAVIIYKNNYLMSKFHTH